jgi:hypothetical protein
LIGPDCEGRVPYPLHLGRFLEDEQVLHERREGPELGGRPRVRLGPSRSW